MTVWSLDDRDNAPEFQYFAELPLLFHKRDVLDAATTTLTGLGYRVVRLDAAAWQSASDLFVDLAAALDFPNYFGHNFDALDDCLRDVAQREYGWSSGDKGLVLVFDNVDALWSREPHTLRLALDIMAAAVVEARLYGHRITCFVRTDDPRFDAGSSEGPRASWNQAERGSNGGAGE